MRRPPLLAALAAFSLGVLPLHSAASQTLVLPLRTVGVSDVTATVVGELLAGELEARGVVIVPASRMADLPRGDAACDEAVCAAAAATSHGASQVAYGSLSRLGEKIILRVRGLRAGETTPFYLDQLTSATEEDLDAVVRRAADGLAAGRSNADQATLDTVTEEETFEPSRQVTRTGVGLRAGFLFPVNDSYGDKDYLASLRLPFKYESRHYLVELTPILGLAWREKVLDWTLLDIFAARVFGAGDISTYVGAGFGMHWVRVEKLGGLYYPAAHVSHSETTPTTDVGIGLMALRTHTLSVIVDLRYHVVFADFDVVRSNGASGIALTFGISR